MMHIEYQEKYVLYFDDKEKNKKAKQSPKDSEKLKK